MIAVFCRYNDSCKRIELKPRGKFIRINSIENLYGCRFSGLIELDDFWVNDKIYEAYKLLKVRQPELFNK